MTRANEPIIRVINVSRFFEMGDERVTALNRVSLDIQPGEFVGLTGPSGSGKSTLLYVMSGMDRPSSGDIWVRGAKISDMDENALANYRRSGIGFVFQSFNLVSSMTALQNVELPLIFAGASVGKRRARATELLQRVGLGSRIGHKPNQLSGGQQQRVAIARALVNDPAVIYADEPTGNLDSTVGAEVMSLLQALNDEGRTIVLISHDPEVVRSAGRVVRLKDGSIVEDSAGQVGVGLERVTHSKAADS
jgi:putative ABC transport system ATP-binding protein